MTCVACEVQVQEVTFRFPECALRSKSKGDTRVTQVPLPVSTHQPFNRNHLLVLGLHPQSDNAFSSSLPKMSFFGFDVTLPRDRSASRAAPAGRGDDFDPTFDPTFSSGLEEDDDPNALDAKITALTAGAQEDVAVYTWGAEDYDGLGDRLEEDGDAFNDDTFGADEVGELHQPMQPLRLHTDPFIQAKTLILVMVRYHPGRLLRLRSSLLRPNRSLRARWMTSGPWTRSARPPKQVRVMAPLRLLRLLLLLLPLSARCPRRWKKSRPNCGQAGSPNSLLHHKCRRSLFPSQVAVAH